MSDKYRKGGATSRAQGLNDAEVLQSRRKYGANVLKVGGRKTFVRRFFENLNDPVIRILLAALAVNFVFVFRGGDVVETVGIAVSVFLAAFISALSESGGESAFKKLSAQYEKQEYRIRRNGRIERVLIDDIVVGDVVTVGAGEKIPADAYVLRGCIAVDQSAITGENKEVNKRASQKRFPSPSCESAIMRGSPVLSGECEIEVYAVGDKTMLGQISLEVQADTRESPLKIRLAKLAQQISRLGYVAAAAVAIGFLFNCFVLDSAFEGAIILMKLKNTTYLFEKLLHAFMLGLTVIVVAVPEGLPMMIAVVLSSNVKKMARDNVLVRKGVGIEAAGSMNLLFTDKTGTLTEGKMLLGGIVLSDGSQVNDLSSLFRRAPSVARQYVLSCCLNTEASLVSGSCIGGNATDRALLASVSKQMSGSFPSILCRLSFDSAVKYSAVQIADERRTVLVKGAPERLLPHVSRCMLPDGKTVEFSPYKNEVALLIDELCGKGRRVLVLAVAEKMPTSSHMPPLTLVCAVSLCDPPRRDAKASVRALQSAGVGVIMITGDAEITARSIAAECGIITSDRNKVIEASRFSSMTDAEIARLLPYIAVVCRALPTDKSRLVRIAQSSDLVVGMTGDGINDAPSLKLADIGFSMGSGTDVAKEAGDIIILDNNLASIVKAVLYGRNIFKSIRKFITLQLTMNFCAVGISIIGPFIGIDAPVTVLQMLWINIIMDTLGGLAFAGEGASVHCMKERPKRRDEPILNRYMVNQIVMLGIFTVALFTYFLLSPTVASHYRYAHDSIYLMTAFFALFIFTSVFNCFNCRTDRLHLFSGLTKNRAFIGIMLLIACVQIAFTYFGGTVLRTAPLLLSELAYTLGLSLTVFPLELLRKLLWRARGRKNGF